MIVGLESFPVDVSPRSYQNFWITIKYAKRCCVSQHSDLAKSMRSRWLS